MINDKIESLKFVRENIVGRNIYFDTPFGQRPLVYADFTASGRAYRPIEEYLNYLLNFYANTHTNDDFTGKTMSTLLHEAESSIKKIVNAGPSGKIVFTGTGATGAIVKLQQILGVYWPPATRQRLDASLDEVTMKCKRPVVFVGPYEHHSNEIMWRQSCCDVIETPLNNSGELDLIALERIVSDPNLSGRQKIGSFSAASNVSGIKTPIYDVAKILHRHGAIACFDFAASAPYVEINMNKDDLSYFDAIFLSPHKFIGGPGASGLLIFNERIYAKNLPPTIAAGGTVDYVTMHKEKYTDDIEEREKPGTPGILQSIKAALAFELKEQVGITRIEEIEHHYFNLFYDHFKNHPDVIIYGPTDAEKKVNIVSFNIKHRDKILHPKFFTKLINDLFGIQTRAGCSCAGPYGHVLLNIDQNKSNQYICAIEENHLGGLKPGWVRLNLHYSFSEEEINYIIHALEMIIPLAHKFLSLYDFNFKTGEWTHQTFRHDNGLTSPQISWKNFIAQKLPFPNVCQNLIEELQKNIATANEVAMGLDEHPLFLDFKEELAELMFFYVVHRKE
ncbi:MAG: hypothetical protein A2504_04835 [Bdellovibrionales bacterium RIFOXYD12_FULL_39_22]|nr:MAG: hypothetical protein A2385_06990 [Bdellovibrionales bacterium RIFOXYB1_FULL_39_21]OFZ42151.1 MAG: hypothetical protein A2485_08960 [Bdellovibrionales bacterium RIFOXYC12_FULL_39_17]OFZ50972.1 MAG: hypothetical protein A2404_05910 [Bdellovibrionales bacterium RIFOXYC1_FULL_39_130]OFZ78195.1 MAG: hypothetical protein A2560_01080 [Bdellovibrionales bacterium RIFOXYD1_FULL_39_84]OFZ93817.1 MAG: hypothetical protein A2504_04835 [Bdellovibrionales bacterium RIFOXYD12_FULL_39_22]